MSLLVVLVTGQPLGAQSATRTVTPFPPGDLFAPLIADPKQPEFLAGVAWVRSPIRNTTVAAVALGENIGVVRWAGSNARDGIQLSLAAGIFAQFDLGRPSNDLVNADYLIGIPLTYRRGDVSLRFRVYHQSSHLGDEFLLDTGPQRINLSFESVEAIWAFDGKGWRLYAGGEYMVRRDPAELRAGILHGGLEYRQPGSLFRLGVLGAARLAGGLDVKSQQHNDWSPAWSVRGGLEFIPPGSTRRWRILLALYDGPSPYGQFFTEEVRYVGAGLHLAL